MICESQLVLLFRIYGIVSSPHKSRTKTEIYPEIAHKYIHATIALNATATPSVGFFYNRVLTRSSHLLPVKFDMNCQRLSYYLKTNFVTKRCSNRGLKAFFYCLLFIVYFPVKLSAWKNIENELSIVWQLDPILSFWIRAIVTSHELTFGDSGI